MSANIPENMRLDDLLKATGYNCPENLQGKTFDQALSSATIPVFNALDTFKVFVGVKADGTFCAEMKELEEALYILNLNSNPGSFVTGYSTTEKDYSTFITELFGSTKFRISVSLENADSFVVEDNELIVNLLEGEPDRIPLEKNDLPLAIAVVANRYDNPM